MLHVYKRGRDGAKYKSFFSTPNHPAAFSSNMAPQENQIHVGTKRGETTIDVQKLLDKPWYKYRHLRKLYGWLCVVLIVQATNGLDGSIMNGMQTLTYWQSYFHHPTGAQLG